MKKIIYPLFLVVLGAYLSSFRVAAPERTIENLKAAYIGESTASAKYSAYAEKATKEGYTAVSKLFEAAARAEGIHAANHAKVLEKLGSKAPAVTPKFTVKSTKDNLMDAAKGEEYEKSTMYPKFISVAKSEESDEAVTSFTWALDTEKKHYNFYEETLKLMNAGTAKKAAGTYYICPKCGNTFDAANLPPDCDFCGRKVASFIKIG